MEAKDRILKGAEELFFKYGIKSITMDDVAKHLSISKKTIYLSFSDKNEILEMLMKDRMKKNELEFQQLADNSENVIAEVFAIMKHLGMIFSQINPNFFYDLQKYHPNTWKLFKQFKEECIEKMVEDSVKKGIKQGLVRSDINTKIIARLRMEEVEMGFNPQVFPPAKFKIIDVQLALLEHFLHGICTLKGHKLINKYKEIIEEE
ncbi:MAG: TetR/AcrR family transcriptional regulator [Bacteroidetes bacterium]|nr:TetR/AcrR family transcriptional regulator [Bacteroidota bacterium]